MGELDIQVQRPSRVRYLVLAVFCSLAFMHYLDRVCMMRAQNDLVRDLGLNQLTAADEEQLLARGEANDPQARKAMESARGMKRMSWILNFFTIGYLLFEIPGGWLGDRWGSRKVLLRIIIWWSVFIALTAWVDFPVRWFIAHPAPWMLVAVVSVSRSLYGAGAAGAFPNVARVLGQWFPFRDRGFAQGFIWMSARMGGAFAPFLFGLLMFYVGWRNAFTFLGMGGIIWAILFYRWFRNRPEEKAGVNAAEIAYIRAGAPETPGDGHLSVPWRRLLTSQNLWALYICHAAICFSGYFFLTFIPKFLENRFHVELGQSEIMTGLPLLIGGCSCLAGGRISDFLIRRTGSRRWGRSLVGFAAMSLAGITVLLATQANTVWVAAAVLCVVAGFQDLAVPIYWSLPADLNRKCAGTIGGAMNMAGGVGAVLGPYLVGELAPRYGWNFVFVVFAAVYALAAVCWLRIDASEALEISPSSEKNATNAG
jgi:MFS transporter, ACS family, glucarate transporter